MLPCSLADGGKQALPEQESGPPAEDDALRAEQVDEVRDARAQVDGGLLQDAGRPVTGGADERGERGLLVLARQREPVPAEDSAGPDVGLQAASRPAAAGPPAGADRRMTPFDRGRAIAPAATGGRDQAGPDARADQAHHRLP